MPERPSVTKRTDEEIKSFKCSLKNKTREKRHRNDYDTFKEQVFISSMSAAPLKSVSSF